MQGQLRLEDLKVRAGVSGVLQQLTIERGQRIGITRRSVPLAENEIPGNADREAQIDDDKPAENLGKLRR